MGEPPEQNWQNLPKAVQNHGLMIQPEPQHPEILDPQMNCYESEQSPQNEPLNETLKESRPATLSIEGQARLLSFELRQTP